MSSKSSFKPKSAMTCRFCKRTWHANTKARVEAYMVKHTMEDCEAAASVIKNALVEREKARGQLVEEGKHVMIPAKALSETEALAMKSYSVVLPGSLHAVDRAEDVKRAEAFLATLLEGGESPDVLISVKEWQSMAESLERSQAALRALTQQLKALTPNKAYEGALKGSLGS